MSKTEFPAHVAGLRSGAYVLRALAFALLALPALVTAQDTIPVQEVVPVAEAPA